jgi:nicotinamidase-related amidase
MATQRFHLLVIDPQNDFCDLPADRVPDGEAPALPVAGAHADMQRLAALIEQGGAGLSDITVTLDSHQRIDIGHPGFWVQGDGEPVSAFTQIRAVDVTTGCFLPRGASAAEREAREARVVAYLQALEAAGRYVHMVWPTHCEIGTWGHNVHADVRRAYNRWEEAQVAVVEKVVKGSNPWTEHYSAVQAEVPDPGDDTTQTNIHLIARLRAADCVYIAGEAGSHCVKSTVEHIAEHYAPNEIGRLVLLTDCMSAVTGFEPQHQAFVEDMRARGVRIADSATVLPELLANAGAG